MKLSMTLAIAAIVMAGCAAGSDFKPRTMQGAQCKKSLATGKHSPSVATLRRYVQACGKHLYLQVS